MSVESTRQTVSAVEEAPLEALKLEWPTYLSRRELELLARFEEAVRADARRDLETALREMMSPPFILPSDDAVDVAMWFVSRARVAVGGEQR